MRPTVPNGHYYTAQNPDIASPGSQEPQWNTASGSLTQDNDESWKESGSTIIRKLPNNQQGFGRIDLEDVLSPYPARDYVNDALAPDSNGSPWSRTYRVHDPNLPVKVVLAWTDTPSLANEPDNFTGVADVAHILVNVLNLTVEVGSTCTTRYIGNSTTVAAESRGEESLPDGTCTSTAYDTTNNVEWIKFFPSVTGATQFTVRVGATQSTNQTFSLVVYNAYDSSGAAPPSPPANVVAKGNTAPSVNITWNTVLTATSYEVRRRSSNSPFPQLVGQPGQSTTSFTDQGAGVSAGAGYLYSVRALNATGVSADGSDFATTMAFTDDPIVSGVTVIKQTHVLQLQSAVNGVRAAVGLAPFAFTPIGSPPLVRAIHLTELRTALDNARAAVQLPPAIYTDPALAPGTVIKAAHVNELRGGVQ